MLNRYDYNGNALSKYDAPLKIQFEKGINAFKKGNMKNPYNFRTMKYREWQRGYNLAYFKNLEKLKRDENRRRGKEVYGS